MPLIITGPNIPAGVESDVMINGLDFYPTILSLIGAKKPEGKIFDGCDLTPLLRGDITDPSLVKNAKGEVRNSMMWHFPNMENTSSLRIGDFKLIRRYGGHRGDTLQLFRLYDKSQAKGTKAVRGDIEEMKDLSKSMPEKVAEMNAELSARIKQMGGRTPYQNPYCFQLEKSGKLAPKVISHQQNGNQVEFSYKNNGNKLVMADLMYTTTGGTHAEEWQRLTAEIKGDKVIANLPEKTTHYFINLIDEKNFIEIYPKIDKPKLNKDKKPYSSAALSVSPVAPVK